METAAGFVEIAPKQNNARESGECGVDGATVPSAADVEMIINQPYERSIRIPAVILIAQLLSSGISAADVETMIARHAAAVNRVESLHVRIRSSSARSFQHSQVENWSETLDSVTEIWRSGEKRRELTRIFRSSSPRGTQHIYEGHGRVIDRSVDAKQMLQLDGWDPEHPFRLPLEFGRNAKEFGSVTGSILVRDPSRRERAYEEVVFLWEPVPFWRLADIAAVGEFLVVPGAQPPMTRLKLASAKDPQLTASIGTLIDLDEAHGFSIARVEHADGTWRDIHEVLSFQEVDRELWLPKTIRTLRTLHGTAGNHRSTVEVEVVSINQEIPDELLQVAFPEGSRVNEAAGNIIHIWGKDGPLESFHSHEAFLQYIYARAREYQSRHRPQGHPSAQGRPEGSLTLLIVNFVLVGLLILFTILRRRLARAGGPPPEAPERLT